jgi:amino-acid N-acetyltransferase
MLIEDNHKIYRKFLLDILAENKLPVNDIVHNTTLFAWMADKQIKGTAGWEQFENNALIRSVSIKKDWQQHGMGSSLYKALEDAAIERGIRHLYLLTTTADGFFLKQGFSVISRDEVPEYIQNTKQFSSTCPASAIVMKKILNN